MTELRLVDSPCCVPEEVGLDQLWLDSLATGETTETCTGRRCPSWSAFLLGFLSKDCSRGKQPACRQATHGRACMHWHLVLAALCSCQGRRDDTRPRVGRGGGLHSTGPLVAVGRGRGGRAGRGWVLCRVAHKVATGIGKSETWREKLGDHGRQPSSPLGGWGPSAHVNQRGWGHYENWLLHSGGSPD